MATETIVETVITANGEEDIDEGKVIEVARAAIKAAQEAAEDQAGKGGGAEPLVRIRGVKKQTC